MLKMTSPAISIYIASQALLLGLLSIRHSDSSFVVVAAMNSIPAVITYFIVKTDTDKDIRLAAVFAASIYISAVCYVTYLLFLPRSETMIALIFLYLVGPWVVIFAGFCFVAKIVRRLVAFANPK